MHSLHALSILYCKTGVLRRMAVILWHLLLTLLLSGQGLCQCYSESSCAGDVVSSSDQRDCCVLQNGLSYNDAGTCRPCIGMIVMYTSYTQCLTEPMCSAVHGFWQSVYDVGEDDYILDIEFALNVVGTTQFPFGLIVSGTITAEAVDITIKRRSLWFPHLMLSLYIGSSDFDRFSQRNVFINGDYPSTDIRLFTVNDEATLEYED